MVEVRAKLVPFTGAVLSLMKGEITKAVAVDECDLCGEDRQGFTLSVSASAWLEFTGAIK